MSIIVLENAAWGAFNPSGPKAPATFHCYRNYPALFNYTGPGIKQPISGSYLLVCLYHVKNAKLWRMQRKIVEIKNAFIIVLFLFILSGCATQQAKYLKAHENRDKYQRIDNILSSSNKAIKPYPLFKYKFAIVENDTPNAWVNSQQGIMVVSTGLLSMFDDDELALIFLHENAHIKYNHSAKNALLSDVTSAAFSIGSLFLPGVGYANLLVNPLVTSGYSRSQELEADRDVVKQCYLLLLSPNRYITTLEKMKRYAVSKGNSADTTGLFDTHPNLQNRIDEIRKMTGPMP